MENRGKETVEERYRKGFEIFSKMCGSQEKAQEVVEQWEKLSPRFSDYLIEFAMGDVYTNKTLNLKERSLITLAMLTALGAERQIRLHVEIALNNGITKEQIEELFIHVLLYAGFHRGWNGLVIAREEIEKWEENNR